ncbi:hypothetical protein KUDE01_008505, partial [Dissostichus eleginoides]
VLLGINPETGSKAKKKRGVINPHGPLLGHGPLSEGLSGWIEGLEAGGLAEAWGLMVVDVA